MKDDRFDLVTLIFLLLAFVIVLLYHCNYLEDKIKLLDGAVSAMPIDFNVSCNQTRCTLTTEFGQVIQQNKPLTLDHFSCYIFHPENNTYTPEPYCARYN